MEKRVLAAILLFALPLLSIAGPLEKPPIIHYQHWVVDLCIAIFFIALVLAISEEFTQLRKSKPMLLAAGLIWGIIAWAAGQMGLSQEAEMTVRRNLVQYAELLLIMLVVMTYINALDERKVFQSIQNWLSTRGYTVRRVFWLTGAASFVLSPLLDNLSTALLFGAMIIAIGGKNHQFVGLGCLNVLIASNAGGVFSPFGDISTLMVWQQQIEATNGPVDFWSFFHLLPSALVGYLIPATAMSFALPDKKIQVPHKYVFMRRGALHIFLLFIATLFTAVTFQNLLGLPGVIGMMTGLSYLQIYGFYLKRTYRNPEAYNNGEEQLGLPVPVDGKQPFDIFLGVARAEWDTLLFLYGSLMAAGGLGYLGYMTLASEFLYTNLGTTSANVSAGLFSAIVENIPAMSVVLNMAPSMSVGQWLLVTLSVGISGNLLSIGSAAGIAFMSQAKGAYTFFSHLKWLPFLLLGYIAAVELHLQLNSALF
ncbi:MAG: sodium:proton antiporter NhaD [Chromatiales bacterium]|nr:sodium:proton antiporter NhaD [Chromatiales bacterium]